MRCATFFCFMLFLIGLAVSNPVQDKQNKITKDEPLRFHSRCAKNVVVSDDGRRATKPEAEEDAYWGSVLTRRPLRLNELFEVEIERVITTWWSHIQMGVSRQSAEEYDFPTEIIYQWTGTWAVDFNTVNRNGEKSVEKDGRTISDIQVGDRVGVMLTGNGTLHYFVNGKDLGVGATGVPENVYGVVDLRGNAAAAVIVDN